MSDVVMKNFKCGGQRYCVGDEYKGPKEFEEKLKAHKPPLIGPGKDLAKADAKLGDPDELERSRGKEKKARTGSEDRKTQKKATAKAAKAAKEAKKKK